MDYSTHKKMLMEDPQFRKALKEIEPEYQIARALIRARIEKNLTQKQLAAKLGTKQSVLSRVENAKTTPTVSFLKRLAEVLNMNLKIDFS
jgi:ribosome-binding protein aMBF1 (putative translation factor)